MLKIILQGGWVMLPLLVCSLVSVTIIIERMLFFKRMTTSGKPDQLLKLVRHNKMAEALDLAKQSPLPIMKVLSAGIHHLHEAGEAMEAAGIDEIVNMRRGLPVLDTIITLSPLLGLLGTIIGMISSFHIMAATGMGQPHAVTGGVAEALIATAAGISVAVLTLIPHNYFLARIEKETAAIETYATRLEIALKKNRGEKRP